MTRTRHWIPLAKSGEQVAMDWLVGQLVVLIGERMGESYLDLP